MIRLRAWRFGATGSLLAAFLAVGAPAGAQTAQTTQPVERVTFDQAIQRAIERNPSSAIAAAGILRAEGLLDEAQANARLQVNGNVSTTTVNRPVEFDGTTVVPRTTLTGTLDIRMPLYAPSRWARRAQAEDNLNIAGLDAADVRKETALATAQAYLAVIARRQVVELNLRARETANAHSDLARQLEQQGTGSRLNLLRAQREVSAVESTIEGAQLLLYRAQEALGVLIVADGPVDTIDEPAFDVPETPAAGAAADVLAGRTDVKLFTAEVSAAERVLKDTRKDAWPYLEGVFQPQSTYPGQFFTPNNSWRALLQLSVPIFDSGRRAGQRTEAQASLNISKATLDRALTGASAEVRAARAAIGSSERALVSARTAADQAREVMNITNISFRAGGATNIEVIDAERSSRDADTQVAVAEQVLRLAKLELLTALGQFPK